MVLRGQAPEWAGAEVTQLRSESLWMEGHLKLILLWLAPWGCGLCQQLWRSLTGPVSRLKPLL